ESEQLLFLTLLGDSAVERFQKICRAWGIETAEPEVDISQVESEILILCGEFDTLTPALYGFQVEEAYPNTTHFLVPDMGHAVLGRAVTNCPIGITLDFLAGNPIDPSCIESEHQFEFFNPQSAYPRDEARFFDSVLIPELNQTTIRPAGWTDIGNNNFFRSPGYDQTSVLIQATAVTPEQWVKFIFNNYKNVGLDSYPTPTENELPPSFAEWEFYKAVDKGDSITIAFSELNNGNTVMVLISGFPEEHGLLTENVLIPILNQLTKTTRAKGN
ncbi:MAG: alpha/beta fold hydrolase, partial [Anaerolineae bacterium]